MKRVLTAVVLIPLVLVIVFRAPLWFFALAIAGIVLLTLHEYLGVVAGYGIEPIRKLTYIVSLLLLAGLFVENQLWLMIRFPASTWWVRTLPILPFLPLIFGTAVVFRREMHMALPAAATSAFGVLYIALSLGMLISLRHSPASKFLVLFTLFSVWAGDTAAYYAGKALGRHKLAPVVSPAKTWEGAAASIIASIVVAFIVFHFSEFLNRLFLAEASGYFSASGAQEPLPWQNALLLGLATNIMAQLGDLFESALKRGANLKDSGSLLPGHGGILDRIDALLFAIPVVWYYAHLSGLIIDSGFYTAIGR